MHCEICGRYLYIIPGFLGYNTTHDCIIGTDIIFIYDEDNDCVYKGLPLELETEEGRSIQNFCKNFLQKELHSKNNNYLLRALRNQTINSISKNLESGIYIGNT